MEIDGLGMFFLVATLCSTCLLVYIIAEPITDTYEEGYHIGYGEHNQTRYEACRTLIGTFSDEGRFARGYCEGYNGYYKKLNESQLHATIGYEGV